MDSKADQILTFINTGQAFAGITALLGLAGLVPAVAQLAAVTVLPLGMMAIGYPIALLNGLSDAEAQGEERKPLDHALWRGLALALVGMLPSTAYLI